MSWILASIAAIGIATVGPLLMVESLQVLRHAPALRAGRRRLRLATAAGLLLAAGWLLADRAAIAAGARSLPVAAVSAGMFSVLFLGLAHPLLLQAARSPAAQAEAQPPRVPLFRAALDVPALLLLVAAAIGLLASPNDPGYRIKGAAIIVAGVAAYFLGPPRAPRILLLCLVAGGFTLLAQWQVPWQRAAGIMAQLAVGVAGFAFCARLLFESARRG